MVQVPALWIQAVKSKSPEIPAVMVPIPLRGRRIGRVDEAEEAVDGVEAEAVEGVVEIKIEHDDVYSSSK